MQERNDDEGNRDHCRNVDQITANLMEGTWEAGFFTVEQLSYGGGARSHLGVKSNCEDILVVQDSRGFLDRIRQRSTSLEQSSKSSQASPLITALVKRPVLDKRNEWHVVLD